MNKHTWAVVSFFFFFRQTHMQTLLRYIMWNEGLAALAGTATGAALVRTTAGAPTFRLPMRTRTTSASGVRRETMINETNDSEL